MPINWPMPMGEGNRGWGAMAGRGGVGSQASWPQPAGDYQTSTSGGFKAAARPSEGSFAYMTPPEEGGFKAPMSPSQGPFATPSSGPAAQWGGNQASPVTYGSTEPGAQQFTYQPPQRQEQGPSVYANAGQRAIYQQAMGGVPGTGGGGQTGYAPPDPGPPPAGPMGMLGGMNAQQLQDILPMLQQLFASSGATGPVGYSAPGQRAMYQGAGGGMPRESSPVVPQEQGPSVYANAGQRAIYQQAMGGVPGTGGQTGYGQASPVTYGSTEPGAQQFTYQPPQRQTGQMGYALPGPGLMSGQTGAPLARRGYYQ